MQTQLYRLVLTSGFQLGLTYGFKIIWKFPCSVEEVVPLGRQVNMERSTACVLVSLRRLWKTDNESKISMKWFHEHNLSTDGNEDQCVGEGCCVVHVLTLDLPPSECPRYEAGWLYIGSSILRVSTSTSTILHLPSSNLIGIPRVARVGRVIRRL